MEKHKEQYAEEYLEYLRKSQMDRDFDEVSVEETLARHRKRLEEFTKSRKINVTMILEEVVSGESLHSRPQMLKLLELVNTGRYAGVVCMDIDRLSRGDSMDSGYIMQVLKINGCKIVTPDKTYDLENESDEQFTDMKFLFSRFEYKTINKRLIAGRNTSATEGKYIGSTPPYGYEIYKLPGVKGNSLRIVPEKAKVVQYIYDLYTEKGYGYSRICTELDKIGIQASYPLKSFDKHVIERILKNPVYIGKIRYGFKPTQKVVVDGKIQKVRTRQRENHQIHEGLHEPIISEEQWNKVQEARMTNLPVNINYELCNPFSRVVKCGKCGRTIVRRTTTQHPPKYRLSCPNRSCNQRSIFLSPFEEAVVIEMDKWLKEYVIQIESGNLTVDTRHQELLEVTEKQLADAKMQQEKICGFLETGVYTVQMFTQRNGKLQEEIENLEVTRQNLIEKIKEQESRSKQSTEIIPKTQHLLDNYNDMTPQQKNDLWKEVVDHIDLVAEPKAKDFHIRIYPKL